VTKNEAGQYQCVVENTMGTISATAMMVVQTMPAISGLPNGPMTAQIGQRLRLECRAEGDPNPNVVWKRHRLGPNNF